MSSFKTLVPVDLEEVKSLLPPDAVVEKVVWNAEASGMDVHWQSGTIDTPFTFALDFPLSDLKKQNLPEKATVRQPAGTKTHHAEHHKKPAHKKKH